MAECIQCRYMDLSDKNDYGEAYCQLRGHYYDPYSSACGSLEYSDSSYQNRESEYNNDSCCYLTTAMCKVLGYDDQCDYLEILRDFRDTYMMQKPECFDLLIEYEVIGPIISRHILQDKETANIMLDNYIAKTIMLIKKGQYEQAINTYKAMVYFLKNKYNLNNLKVDIKDVHFTDHEKLDKQKIRTLAKDTCLMRG